MRTHLAAGFGAAVLVTGTLAGAPAAQARPAVAYHFHVPNGNTWTDGTVTFSNRSVLVEGVQKSVASTVEGCRNTLGYTLDSHGDLLTMNASHPMDEACSTSKSFDFVVPADVVGGAAFVRVCLADGYYTAISCNRYGG
ncbi:MULTISPECIES: hypothetical protein [unclassified Streptomyces]|uniref:hypothetical protein n=1 Tax=unclassified Streptomyces TaxID=2593676 RepID=UPI0007F994B5|nr:hypothetical protein [Streptomyces sp. SAT1]ANO42281.1 hypothetical protein A8713_034050 [Streptomyces sp. SAT1]